MERPMSSANPCCCVSDLGRSSCFHLLRFLNVYGDPAPWSAQKNGAVHLLFVYQRHQIPAFAVVCLAHAWPDAGILIAD